jgi:enoyl-CoA hydratase/carnithine racemase
MWQGRFSLRRGFFAFHTPTSRLSTTTGNGNGLVVLTIQNHIATLTLNDPNRLNALSEEMGIQFQNTVNSLKQVSSLPFVLLSYSSKAIQRHEIRACIITGAGDAFSAGGNLDWLEDRHNHSPHSNYQTMIQFYNFFLSIRHLNVPTIAAINGHAIGAGMCMTLGCDFRIAAENAKIGFTFVKLGIHPGPS